MRRHERIYIVGSGTAGFGISEETDCTVYLLDGGEECVLIDAGAGIEPERILENIRKDGIRPERISKILLTHGHGDHSGGAYALSRACDAEVYALSETAQYVSTGDLDELSLKEAIEAGVYGKDYSYQPCEVKALSDGETIQVGSLCLTALRMEGHCAGHACYETVCDGKKILFSGDSVFNYGKIALQAIWDCDLQKYIETCRKLEEIHPDILLPSHGAFLMEKGYTYIDKAMRQIRALGIPGNIIGE